MEAKIYVGTYGKYNEGSLHGDYLDLTEFSNKEEFYAACKVLHSDEDDAEFMFQDYDGIVNDMPDDWRGECYIKDIAFEFLKYFEGEDDKAAHFLEWLKHSGYNGDFDYLKETFETAYIGEFDSEKAFAEHHAEELGYYAAMEKAGINMRYFDEEAFAVDLFCDGFNFYSGVVFQSI